MHARPVNRLGQRIIQYQSQWLRGRAAGQRHIHARAMRTIRQPFSKQIKQCQRKPLRAGLNHQILVWIDDKFTSCHKCSFT